MLAHNARSKQQQVNKVFQLIFMKSEGGKHIYAEIFLKAMVCLPHINATFPVLNTTKGKNYSGGKKSNLCLKCHCFYSEIILLKNIVFSKEVLTITWCIYYKMSIS
jgi:hypothetical protein